MSKLLKIWQKRVRRGPMDSLDSIELITGKGLAGDANNSKTRQVTLMSREAWEAATAEVGQTIDPTERRANLYVEGVDLAKSRGKVLQLGECRIELVGETTPCRRMDEVAPGLESALRKNWRGGAFGRVVAGGVLHVGDEVAWVTDVVNAEESATGR